ncbi:MAG: 3-methyl-2-oxobutanoate hydroxymethyltransferase [Rickettsiales bacterium]|jgi:3-methyl-2-oxobutanoate hydroxymethyltransferase
MSSKIHKIQNQTSPITCIAAYTYPIAKILDNNCDMILVGDSLGMSIYGMKNTQGVSVQMMIDHGKAVVRGASKALIVIDIPFGSFEKSKEQALATAQKIIDETNCDAVKIECLPETIETIEFLVQNKIPVMGHVGLLPQKVKDLQGYKYQGRDENSAAKILQIAIDLEKAGAFAIVIEGVPSSLASAITKNINIPTIGIGASNDCSGQVLVIDDLVGINQDFKPRFVKQYANLTNDIERSVAQFCDDVKNRKFPAQENLI